MRKYKLAVIFSIIFVLFAVLGIAKFSKNSEAAEPTITIEGGPGEIVVGDVAYFRAYYDPDGGGPEERVDVTESENTRWGSFNGAIARSLGGGSFRGRGPGEVGVSATMLPSRLGTYANLRVVEPPEPFLCERAASPIIKVETNGYGTYQTGGNVARNDSRTEEISVPVGTRLNFTSSESAEPLSRVEITYPNGFVRYFNEPDWNGRSFTTDPMNDGSEVKVYAVQRCHDTDCAYSNGHRCESRVPPKYGEEPCVCRRTGERWRTTLTLTNNPPSRQEFGTVAVSSNIPTTWDVTFLGVRQTDLSRSSPSSVAREGAQPVGPYVITNIPLEVRNYNGKDWDRPVITPSQTQTLTDGGTITFNITYSEKSGTGSGCDISVTSNLPTSWGMDGPIDEYDRVGRGTYALYEDLGAGRYRLEAEDISGYNKEINPLSMNCADGGSVDFVIDYQQAGGGGTRKRCVAGNSCGVVNESGPDQCSQNSDCVNPPLDCSPATHPDVNLNSPANFSASGGTAPYSWRAPSGSPNTGSGASFSTDYNSPGNKTITLTDSASASSVCRVEVCPAGGCPTNEFPSGMHQYADLDTTDGYASDDNSPSGRVTVNIYDGTNLIGSTVTTGSNNNFSVNLPVSVRDGNVHWIHARAVDYLPGGGTGPEVALSNTPLRVQNVGGTHFECVAGSCISRPGAGGDGCNPSILACTGNRYSCSGASCGMDYTGSYTSSNCDNACSVGGTRLECRNNSCARVSGGGPNIDNCSAVGQGCVAGKHLECKFGSCSLEDGTGPNLDGCGSVGSSCSGGIDYGCNAVGFCEAKRGGSGNCTPANEEWDCPQPPPQCTLEADKQKLVTPPPGTVTVSWSCLYAKTCTLNGVSVSPVSGSKDYVPNQTTYYTLRCTGKGSTVGEWTREVGVKVYRFIEGILREVRPN